MNNKVKIDESPIRERPSTILRYITSNRDGIRISIESSSGWDLKLPIFKPEDLRIAMRICNAFLSFDTFEILRRQCDDIVELIDATVLALTKSNEEDLNLSTIRIGWGPYYGQPLSEIPEEWLLNEFRHHKINDFLVYEYVRQNRKQWLSA